VTTPRRAWVTTLLVAATVVAFSPVLWNGFVNWDDDLGFTNNPHYRGLSASHLGWMFTTMNGGHYKPFVWITFGLDYLLWGMEPRGYHLTSLVLHLVNVVLVFGLVRMLLRLAGLAAGWRREMAATAGTLFFALHPLRVESVAWLSERNGMMAAGFYILAVIAYLRAQEARPSSRWLAVSLGCFTLGLASKATGMTLPLLLLVLDVYPLRRLRVGVGRLVIEKLPYVLLAAGAVVLSAYGVERALASRSLAEHGLLPRIAQSAFGLCFYLWKTVLPVRLSPVYLLEANLDPMRPRYVLCLLAVLGVTAALVLVRRHRPWALAAWLAYLVLALPILGFVQRGFQITADRYTYLICLPWAVLVAAAAWRFAQSRVALGASVVGLAVLGFLTFRQAEAWRSSRSLWEQALRVDPTNYIAYLNRGADRASAQDLLGAISDYTHALRLKPGDPLTSYNRGTIRQRLRDLDGALADYSAAIRGYDRYVSAYHDRGTVWHAKGDFQAAIADYTEALRRDPRFARAYVNRAGARYKAGDLEGAIADYGAALEIDPNNSATYDARAVVREERGDLAGAAEDYARALAAAPPGWRGRDAVARRLESVRSRLGR
jgi:tetratricopeptide (TPR) repeat protein